MPPGEIDQVIKHAIESNPEVQSAWYVFRYAGQDVDAARGGYYPTVDLVGRAGRESRNFGTEENFSDASGELTLTQSIFDGFFTRSEVERLSNAELVRYYELLDTAERTALEALWETTIELLFGFLAMAIAEGVKCQDEFDRLADLGVGGLAGPGVD